MGFFSNVGEALFGTKTKAAGKKNVSEGAAINKATVAQAKGVGQQYAADAKKYGQTAEAIGKESAQYGKEAGKLGVEAGRLGEKASDYDTQASEYDLAAKESMGGSATDYMNKANLAAKGQSAEAAQAATMAGTKSALKGARTAGLNKGQAALIASQGAGDIYSKTYESGLESGRNQYQGATQQIAGQGSEMANRSATTTGLQQGTQGLQQSAQGLQQTARGNQLSAYNTQQGARGGQLSAIGAQQTGGANMINAGTGQQAAAGATMSGTLGAVGGVIGGILSDENLKTNVKKDSSFNNIMSKIKNQRLAHKENQEENKPSVSSFGDKIGLNNPTIKKIANVAAPIASAMGGNVGAFASGLFSDEGLKQNIKSDDSIDVIINKVKGKKEVNLDDILKKVKPVSFEYKDKVGIPGERIGVIAQDLENTPLKEVVKETPEGDKYIDTNELTPALLDLVIQLGLKVKALENKGQK